MRARPRFRIGPRTRFAISAVGYALTAVILWWGFTSGHLAIPGGDAYIWDRAGDQIRAGVSPYHPNADGSTNGLFFFGPPWALAFAATSWMPLGALAIGIIGLEVAALRYVAGNWLRVGYCLWLPLVAFELPSSQFNLVIAAAIAAALRGDARWAPLAALLKISPILAVARHQWPTAAVVIALSIAITLPWLTLWADWVRLLVSTFGREVGPEVPIPFVLRLAIAGAVLLFVRRPTSRGVAAVLAIAAFHWITIVLFLGLIPSANRKAPTSNAPKEAIFAA